MTRHSIRTKRATLSRKPEHLPQQNRSRIGRDVHTPTRGGTRKGSATPSRATLNTGGELPEPMFRHPTGTAMHGGVQEWYGKEVAEQEKEEGAGTELQRRRGEEKRGAAEEKTGRRQPPQQ